MVAQFTMRTHRVKQGFRFVEGIWLHQNSSQIRLFCRKKLLYIIHAQPSNIKTMLKPILEGFFYTSCWYQVRLKSV